MRALVVRVLGGEADRDVPRQGVLVVEAVHHALRDLRVVHDLRHIGVVGCRLLPDQDEVAGVGRAARRAVLCHLAHRPRLVVTLFAAAGRRQYQGERDQCHEPRPRPRGPHRRTPLSCPG
ncbi:hypothetical protein G5V59_00915 [Nocardioides sp. W3-2-3]|nr:hypothetical protein [Nocardioides convexus]